MPSTNPADHRPTRSGYRGSSEYMAWVNMRQRCLNPKCKQFDDYGGRGITVCRRWDSFDAFLADMGPKLSPELTLERKNNSIGYKPSNCVWATRREQQSNTRINRRLTCDGVTKTIAGWARAKGLLPQTISNRLARGWSVRRSLR